MNVASVAIQFTAIDLAKQVIDSVKNRILGLARANKEVQQSFDRMTQAAKLAGMASIATRALAHELRPAVDYAGDLQKEMLGARAELAGGARDAKMLSEELAGIKSTAFKVQAWTPYNMGQIVALEKNLLKSGARYKDMVGEHGAASSAAALGVYQDLDPAAVGKAMITIAEPFGIQGDKFGELADQIARASSASTVGVEELATSAKYAAPGLAMLRISTQQMLTMLAMLSRRGIEASMAGTGLRMFFAQAAKHKIFKDAAGNLKPFAEIIDILDKKTAHMGEADKLAALTKVFDMRGAVVAMAFMQKMAGASYEEIEARMAASLSLQEKIKIGMEGFSNQLRSLKTTSQSTIADLFQPALVPLTMLIAKTNEWVAALGEASQKHEWLGKSVSGVSLTALGVGGAVTAVAGAEALHRLRQVWKGVGGVKGMFGKIGSAVGGIAAGVVEGKALEAATGVQPVFVTNWPAGGIGGTGSALADAAAGAGAASGGKNALSWLGKMAAGSKSWLAALPALATGSVGAAGIGTVGLAVAGAGAAGYGIGTFLEHEFGLGSKLGSMLFDLFNNPPEVKNDIQLNLTVNERGQVTAQTSDMNTKADINLKRGRF